MSGFSISMPPMTPADTGVLGGGDDAAGGEIPTIPTPANEGRDTTASQTEKAEALKLAKDYFAKTFDDAHFVAQWKKDYGGADAPLDHHGKCNMLGGILSFIDDARVELVNSGTLSEERFAFHFTVGKVAHRVTKATSAAGNAPRGAQRHRRDGEASVAVETHEIIPKLSVRWTRAKQDNVVRHARAARVTPAMRAQPFIDEALKAVSDLQVRYERIGDVAEPGDENEARRIWIAVSDMIDKTRAMGATLHRTEYAESLKLCDDLLKDFELITAAMVRNWSIFDFTHDRADELISGPLKGKGEAATGKTDPVDIKNKTAASSRASNTVKRGLERWDRLQSGTSTNYSADFQFTEAEQKIKDAMEALTGTVDNYFKQNPLPSAMCFAAFSRTQYGNADVSMHGSAPEWFTSSLRSLLHAAVGAGKLDSKRRRV